MYRVPFFGIAVSVASDYRIGAGRIMRASVALVMDYRTRAYVVGSSSIASMLLHWPLDRMADLVCYMYVGIRTPTFKAHRDIHPNFHQAWIPCARM